MQIILIRHGEPLTATNKKCDAAGFARWVKRYKHSEVAQDSRPDWKNIKQYKDYHLISSTLPRAKASAHIAFNHSPMASYSWLNEMDIPRYPLPFTLRAWTWVYVNRGLWMLGLKGKFESYAEAKKRAKQATDSLIALANQHKTVVAFGHGYMNLHIRWYLSEKGWQVIEKDNSYWGISRLVLEED